MKIEKSKGLTVGERKVAQICERSCLSLWSYPNLFYSPNKELCDVLIVFDDIVFIISEKTSEFNPQKRGITTEWRRFKKHIIDKSDRQLNGAEKWLKQFPDKVFMDSACTKSFPIPISKNSKFIKISVVNGLNKINELRDNAESLGIELPSDMQFFEMQTDNFIHLLDEYTFPIVFGELDTAPDLISYFLQKENLIKSHKIPFLPPESDLLVMFLSNLDINTGKHCLIPDFEKYDTIFIDNPEDPYKDFFTRPEVKRYRQANEKSYLWDSLIETYNKALMDGRIIPSTNFSDMEKIVKIMSKENRYFRRILSEKILTMYQNFVPLLERRVLCMQSPSNKELAYMCLILQKYQKETQEQFEKKSYVLLDAYSKLLKNKFPHYKQIIGFTKVFPPIAPVNVYFSLFERELTEADIEYIQICKEQFKVGANIKPLLFKHTAEYPCNDEGLKIQISKKIPVNTPCPCGSGKKYKKCCGRLY